MAGLQELPLCKLICSLLSANGDICVTSEFAVVAFAVTKHRIKKRQHFWLCLLGVPFHMKLLKFCLLSVADYVWCLICHSVVFLELEYPLVSSLSKYMSLLLLFCFHLYFSLFVMNLSSFHCMLACERYKLLCEVLVFLSMLFSVWLSDYYFITLVFWDQRGWRSRAL